MSLCYFCGHKRKKNKPSNIENPNHKPTTEHGRGRGGVQRRTLMVGHLPQGQILDSSGLMASEALHWGAAGSWGGALCTAAIAVGNKPHLYCSLSSLTLCWSGIWILPLPLLLNKPSRENNERQWKGREERRRKERERG